MATKDKFTERERERWQEVIDFLSDEMPPGLPVRVRRVDYKRQFGRCVREDGRYMIEVAKRLDYSAALYTLAEEWAHALEWNDDHERGEAWAQAYNDVLKALHREAGE